MSQLTHLILTPLYPPARFGGVEKIVQQLAEGLVGAGDNVVVFSFDPKHSEYIPDHNASGVAVHRIAHAVTSRFLDDILLSQNNMVEAVTNYKNGGNPAVIHAHDWFVAPAALTLRERLGVPVLAVFHSDKRTEYGNRIDEDRQRIHEIQKRLAHGADGILCYSEFMRNCIATSMNVSPHRIGIFRCGIDEGVPQRLKLLQPGTPPTLLYLGRLAPEKDVGTLVKAFCLVIEHHPKCILRIVGDGSERMALGRMVTELGLDNNVVFIPFTASQERVNEELLNADVLVLPSVFEPFGLVVLEAISRRVPVIVPASGGPAEVIRDGVTGWCFTPGYSVELAQKILECVGNSLHAATMASVAIQDANRRFRWTAAVSTLRNTSINLTFTEVVV